MVVPCGPILTQSPRIRTALPTRYCKGLKRSPLPLPPPSLPTCFLYYITLTLLMSHKCFLLVPILFSHPASFFLCTDVNFQMTPNLKDHLQDILTGRHFFCFDSSLRYSKFWFWRNKEEPRTYIYIFVPKLFVLQVNKIFKTLHEAGSHYKLDVKKPPNGDSLPPASFQRFLRSNRKIPGIVLTDHSEEYTNK